MDMQLAELFEDRDPRVFWSKYVSATDFAALLLTERKTLLGWCHRAGIKPITRRHPDTGKRSLFFTGKRSLFFTVEQAKAVIAARQ